MYEPGTETLNTLGIWSSVVCTWVGFTLMFFAIFWGIDFHRKMRMMWRKIQRKREARRRAQEEAAAGGGNGEVGGVDAPSGGIREVNRRSGSETLLPAV
jgi:hypothetical protein